MPAKARELEKVARRLGFRKVTSKGQSCPVATQGRPSYDNPTEDQ